MRPSSERERAGPGGRLREGVFDSAPPRGVGLRKSPASYVINSVPQSPRLHKWAKSTTPCRQHPRRRSAQAADPAPAVSKGSGTGNVRPQATRPVREKAGRHSVQGAEGRFSFRLSPLRGRKWFHPGVDRTLRPRRRAPSLAGWDRGLSARPPSPPRGAVTCLQLRTASPSALRASGPCSPWQRHRAACRAREVVCHHGFSTTISKSWVAGLPPPRTPTSCRPGEEISFRTGWSCPCWF